MSGFESVIPVGVKNKFPLKIAISLKYNFKKNQFLCFMIAFLKFIDI